MIQIILDMPFPFSGRDYVIKYKIEQFNNQWFFSYSSVNHPKQISNKKYVRLQVHGGGCAGFEYAWSFEDEKEEEDVVVDDLVVIDDINEGYIKGLEVDYKKEIFGSNFEFNN